MAISDWIDELVKVAGSIDGMKAPRVFARDEFPDAIVKYPIALTFVENVSMFYPDSGPNQDVWVGSTEFHLVGDTSKKHYPRIMRYYELIRNAFTAKRLLLDVAGRSVLLKLQAENGPSIEMVVLQYGSEAPHLGLVAHWRVWERYS